MNALAATAHLKENAMKLIDKTQGLYGETVNAVALFHGVDPKLILAVIVVESEGNTKVVSWRGAEGLMQLMPRTAMAMGAEDPQEPLQNIMAGTKYLNELRDQYGFGSLEEALVAYNMGPRKAKQWLLKHPPEEYVYVKNVMYVYRMIDEKKQADMQLAQDVVKKLANQDMLFGLRSLVVSPRLFSIAIFPITILNMRKNEVEFENQRSPTM